MKNEHMATAPSQMLLGLSDEWHGQPKFGWDMSPEPNVFVKYNQPKPVQTKPSKILLSKGPKLTDFCDLYPTLP